jgi:hypothetical protein
MQVHFSCFTYELLTLGSCQFVSCQWTYVVVCLLCHDVFACTVLCFHVDDRCYCSVMFCIAVVCGHMYVLVSFY